MRVPRFVCFDTETTGFDSAARVLSVGLVFFQEGEISSKLEFRFLPEDVDWEGDSVKEALAINGLSYEALKNCQNFACSADRISRLLADYDVWVAHNMQFDFRMLAAEYTRCAKVMPLKPKTIRACTLQISREIGEGSCNKLASVAQRCGVKLDKAHTAIADAEATARIFIHMVQNDRVPKMLHSRLSSVLSAEATG